MRELVLRNGLDEGFFVFWMEFEPVQRSDSRE